MSQPGDAFPPAPSASDGPAGVPDPGTDLGYLVDFERLVIELSGRLINLRGVDMDREITHALGAIGRFARVDRSYIFRFSPDRTRFSNTHEWCADGIEAMGGRLQDVPVERFAWAMEQIKAAGVLHVPDVEGLPKAARAVYLELRQQSVRSLINVPLVCGRQVLGLVGFDSVRGRKEWGEDHIRVLKIVGEMIAGAIERERATAALTRQVAMETLVADISSGFISVSSEGVDGQIDGAIARIGAFTGVDRSYVFRLSADGRLMRNTHEWCATGIEPHIDRSRGVPAADFSWSLQWLLHGENLHVPDVAALPLEAEGERAEFGRQDIKTLIVVPIMERGRMVGFLGFDAVRTHRVWTEDDIRLLRMAGEMIGGALARRSAEERLRVSLEEKDVLLREIHHRVKNNLQVVHSLLYLQADAIRGRADPVALDAFRQSCGRIRSMAVIHERLYRSDDLSSVDVDEYLQGLIPDLLAAYSRSGDVKVHVDAGHVHLAIDLAIPCGLILNELVANCLEHAFPGAGGEIHISLKAVPGGLLALEVADDGIGFTPGRDWRQGGSLGLQLVSDLIDQLDGEVLLHTRPGGGTRFRISFPVPGP